MNVAEHILFTGAGFTHNFGAPLAGGVWSRLVSHRAVQARANLREQLLNGGLDFEQAWADVRNEERWSAEDRKALSDALDAVFAEIDLVAKSESIGADRPFQISLSGLQRELIGRFVGSPGIPGLFFTLNQDLFIERMYYNGPALDVPGVQVRGRWFSSTTANHARGHPEKRELPIEANVPTAAEMTRSAEFLYVKLHGSWDWLSSSGDQAMVIGGAKPGQISTEPLLRTYFDLFSKAFETDPRRVLCIGYGFRDEHINEVFASSGSSLGTRFWVVSPQSPGDFRRQLQEDPTGHGRTIWNSLGGYYCHQLKELLPAGQHTTPAWSHLCESFWGAA